VSVRDSSGKLILDKNHPGLLKRAQEAKELARDIMLKMGARKTTKIETSDFTQAMAGGTQVPGVGTTPPAEFGSGTCRAGADRRNSVVNSDFECHDVEGLFICDNGVVPASGAGAAITAYVSCYAWRRIVAKHFTRA